MKALVWTGMNSLEIRDTAPPCPGDDEVVVRVSHAGICGSDVHIWRGEHPRAKPPLIMGHEFSGTVEEPGRFGTDFPQGTPVVVYPVIGCGQCHLCRTERDYICGSLGLIGIDRNGGMAELVAVPARKLHRLPAGTDMVRAALVEPLAVGIHAIGRCNFEPGCTAAVVGAGPIGAAVGLAAKQAGAKQVLISDVSGFRLDVMRRLGFHAVNASHESLLEAVREATDGKGAEFVFEATGIPCAAHGVEQLAAIGGTLVIVGVFPEPVTLQLRDVCFRELAIIGIRHYTPQEFDRAVALVASGQLDVKPLITDTYPLDHGIGAFERAATGTDTEKVLIRAS